MAAISYNGKSYEVDGNGFLVDHTKWDEGFAQALAASASIAGLTPRHLQIIHYIRDTFGRTGVCPLVYDTCRNNGLFVRDLQKLFPTGYLRGACKLAGITYEDRFVNYYGEEGHFKLSPGAGRSAELKTYSTNVAGFLTDSTQWDEKWAVNKAVEIGIQVLTPAHWRIIRFLRGRAALAGGVPTVYETCEANRLELAELERLFPPGYQRGAVKIAGLWTC
jgi:tRNA 2-thiouridine synthesizing protein E